jgi:hypothetical protein
MLNNAFNETMRQVIEIGEIVKYSYPKGAYLIECSLCSLGQFLLEVPTDMKTPISLRRVKRKTSVGNLRDEDAKQCF